MTPRCERRAYRSLRIASVLARSLPAYLWLAARDRLSAVAGVCASSEGPTRRWERVHEATAARVDALVAELGGLLVKFAQVVGARGDIFPAAFVCRLARYHDAVEPRPFEALRPQLEAELGPLDAHFAWVDTRALAAASLAQVHRARLHDGREVVIKIQYPEIERIARLDIANVRRVAALLSGLRLLPRGLDLRSIVGEVSHFVSLELDFEREAQSTEHIARDFAGNPEICVPSVQRALSSRKRLVLEYLEGVPVAQVDALRAAGHEPRAVLARITRLYAAMLFEHDFFHGDPHPGNLLVLPDGRIGLLDFGLAKALPGGFGFQIARVLGCALAKDAEGTVAAARALGISDSTLDPVHFQTLIGMLLGDIVPGRATLSVLSGSGIARVPEHFPLIVRTLVLLSGLSHTLAPGQGVVASELLRALRSRAAPVGISRPDGTDGTDHPARGTASASTSVR